MSWNYVLARLDIAYIPTTDALANSALGIPANPTNAGYGSNPPYYGPGSTGIDTFPSSNTYYQGQIRPDEQYNGVIAAAVNTADYQAQVIRNDSTYKTVIYTVGLGGAADLPVDDTLLERIANDPRSPIYNPSLMKGTYYNAPTIIQLNQAFADVAGEILRLSK